MIVRAQCSFANDEGHVLGSGSTSRKSFQGCPALHALGIWNGSQRHGRKRPLASGAGTRRPMQSLGWMIRLYETVYFMLIFYL